MHSLLKAVLALSLASATCVLPALTTSTLAQSLAPTRMRGLVQTLTGTDLALKLADGTAVNVHLADNVQVSALAKANAADIKPGTFIGAGARPLADGTLQAVQIVIFPEAMRGVGEGHRAWAVMPEATMTNAAVADAVTGVSGPVVTLKYKDGEKKLAISADASVLALLPTTIADVKAGAEVQFNASKDAAGVFQAARIIVLRDGVNPM